MKFSLFTIPIALSLSMAAAFADELEDAYLEAAEQIPYVDYDAALRGESFGIGAPQERTKAIEKVLHEVMGQAADRAQIEKLAEHRDARVRTLALMKLYAIGDSAAFRSIARLSADTASTFPKLGLPANPILRDEDVHPQPMQTWEVSREMLEMIGYQLPPPDYKGEKPSFETWSAPRLDNPDWIGWQEFLYKRASVRERVIRDEPKGVRPPRPRAQVTGPRPAPEPDPKMVAYKAQLDAGPAAVRTWLWLAIAERLEPPYENPLATEAEIIEAGKKLGPDALLAFVTTGARAGLREPRIDDPEKGRKFILAHAKDLFREQDAKALAGSGYFIAAADVDPANASTWIRQGLPSGSGPAASHDQAKAMAALLALQGDREQDFVLKWFYDDSGKPETSSFLHEYQQRRPAGWEKAMKAIVGHPKFEQLSVRSAIQIAHLTNILGGGELLPKEHLYDQYEPEIKNRLLERFGFEAVKYRMLEAPTAAPRKPKWAASLPDKASSVSLSPDGSMIAVGQEEGPVLLFDAATGAASGEIPVAGMLSVVRFRKGDGALIVVAQDGKLTEWDARARKRSKEIMLWGIECREATLSASGNIFASRDPLKFGVSVFDVTKGATRWRHPVQMRAFGSIALSPDGSRLVVSDGFQEPFLLFDTAKPEPIAKLDKHSGKPARAIFSPDGRVLLTTADDTKVIVWNSADGKPLHEYQSAQIIRSAIGFTADSKGLLLESADDQLCLHDLATGKGELSLEAKWRWAADLDTDSQGKMCVGVGVGSSAARAIRGSSERVLVCWSLE